MNPTLRTNILAALCAAPLLCLIAAADNALGTFILGTPLLIAWAGPREGRVLRVAVLTVVECAAMVGFWLIREGLRQP